MAEERKDFVRVTLTAKGEEIAQGPPRPKDYDGPTSEPCIRVCGGGSRAEGSAEGGYDFCFAPGKIYEVTAGEWNSILSREMRDGEPLFAIALPVGGESEGKGEDQ